MLLTDKTIGFAICGSFCTFGKVLSRLQTLCNEGFKIIPIMSFNAFSTDTRFGSAESFAERLENMTGNKVICTIADAEPIGPKKMLDLLIVAPCTGNTLAKLAVGIADTPVTLAVKSQLRNARPVLIGISTNDALGTAAANIGTLMSRKHYYFIPYRQDDFINKPTSVVADFSQILPAATAALEGRQLQPMLLQ
ncbi:MAG: dipicolinate synthase subunit B [Clostridia bacterium]|nr:dipicolinate synthase subunit B [Clostridia bacterium]